MNIRKITSDDVETVATLWHATKRDAYPYLETEQTRTLKDDLTFFEQKILPRNEVWVAEGGEGIVGFLAIRGNYIDRLYVSPAAQRVGIGTALLVHAITLSPNGLELHTHQKNLSACSFYEKHGFKGVRFGISPSPESEPDVEYHWQPR